MLPLYLSPDIKTYWEIKNAACRQIQAQHNWYSYKMEFCSMEEDEFGVKKHEYLHADRECNNQEQEFF